MSLSGTVQSATSGGALGFDTDTIVTSEVAKDFLNQGYSFCIRYLSLSSPQREGDLMATEATNILAAGLALMPVQHVLDPGWYPTEVSGTLHGSAAVANAKEVGFPAGVNIWCDLEGVAAGVQAQDVIDYCTSWYKEVEAGGFKPGLYVGANVILNGQQLYGLPFSSYWQSASWTPELPNRGWQMVQKIVADKVNGIYIDGNQTHEDSQGDQVKWLKL